MALRPRMRPEFILPCQGEARDFFVRLRDTLVAGGSPYVGQVLNRHAYIQLARDQRSLLSPYLNLQLVDDEGECTLRGRFTPHPAVWTGFMAVYGVLGMIALGCLVFGLAQLTVKETPWVILAVPVCLGVAGFVYGAAVIGQGLTMDQMYEMRVFAERLARGDDPHRRQGNIL